MCTLDGRGEDRTASKPTVTFNLRCDRSLLVFVSILHVASKLELHVVSLLTFIISRALFVFH